LVLAPDGLPSGATVTLGEAPRATPFFPSTSRTFRQGQRIRVFARVFGRDVASVEATLTLRQAGQSGPVVSAAARTHPSSTEPNALECEAPLPLADTPPGRYVLELTVTQGKTTLTRAVTIEVVK
jgi:hypothetical protein